MGTGRFLLTLAFVGLLASGCSSSETADAGTTTTQPEAESPTTTAASATTEAPTTTAPPETTTTAAETTTTEAPETTTTTTAAAVTTLPDTPVTATLGNGYDFQGSPTSDPALLPAPEGSVEARWYRAGDVYAVIYAGLDPATEACPGNSALTQSGFDFVSNAELPNAACPGFPTRIDSDATRGVQICGDQVGYLTLIPSDTVAQVFASVEAPDDAVGGYGITAPALIDDPSAVPEIDPASLSC